MNPRAAALGALTLIPVAVVARAEIYMSQDQAARLIFPGVDLKLRTVFLGDQQMKTIESKSDEAVRNKNLQVFVGPQKQAVFIDQVVGKHEFITIGVGIDSSSKVAGVEIIEYRETYGQQVRNEAWRKQFVGKDSHAAIQVGKDIKNISGATLSSSHVAAGVRRLLRTYEVLRSTL